MLLAKQVIVTVPLGVLKKGAIAFHPPLPAAKQLAIKRLAMGSYTKVRTQTQHNVQSHASMCGSTLKHSMHNQVLLHFKSVFWPSTAAFLHLVNAKGMPPADGQPLWAAFPLFVDYHYVKGVPLLAGVLSKSTPCSVQWHL